MSPSVDSPDSFAAPASGLTAVPSPSLADREQWLRQNCDTFEPAVADHIRCLLQLLDEARSQFAWKKIAEEGRPPATHDCIVINEKGRPTFGRVSHGRVCAHPDNLTQRFWDDGVSDLGYYLPIPPLK